MEHNNLPVTLDAYMVSSVMLVPETHMERLGNSLLSLFKEMNQTFNLCIYFDLYPHSHKALLKVAMLNTFP